MLMNQRINQEIFKDSTDITISFNFNVIATEDTLLIGSTYEIS